MKITILGCGASAGVPMIGGADGAGDWGQCDPREPKNRRTRSSIVVESDNGQRLLVDASPDLRDQLIDNRIPGIDAILFTHAHADHIAGIDDIRLLNRIAQRPLDAFGMQVTLDEVSRRFGYAFNPWKPPHFFRPVLVARPVEPCGVLEVAGLNIKIFRQNHGKIDSLGLRVGAFGYSTDVVALDEPAFTVLEGVDTWVVDCFLRGETHWTHANLSTVLAWVERLRPRRTILTHMGTTMDWAWMEANLPKGIEAGFDGMVLTV
jgi:phosphoribosyl 1,2-cyclic phosphate phosphodiesterase